MLLSIKKAIPFKLQQETASQNLIGKSNAKNKTTRELNVVKNKSIEKTILLKILIDLLLNLLLNLLSDPVSMPVLLPLKRLVFFCTEFSGLFDFLLLRNFTILISLVIKKYRENKKKIRLNKIICSRLYLNPKSDKTIR